MSRLLLLSVAAAFALSSCQTTGDPSQGGLFQWSSRKADVRSNMMQQQLQDIEADTASQQARSRALEDERAAKQRKLNSLDQ